MNKLTIYLDDNNKVKLKSQNPISFEDLLQITQSAILGQAIHIMKTVPDKDYEKVEGWFYDLMNQAFSKTLEVFSPDMELRPDLTTQAILEAENKLIEKQYKEKING